MAIQRYLFDGATRLLIPMWLEANFVADIRAIDSASIVWQELRIKGEHSPTWAFSDSARKAGAHAMLYSSLSRPDLSHVVIFKPECMSFVGPVADFHR